MVVGTEKAGGSLPAGHVVHVSEEVAASVAEYLPATKVIPCPARQHTLPRLSPMTVCYDYQSQVWMHAVGCGSEDVVTDLSAPCPHRTHASPSRPDRAVCCRMTGLRTSGLASSLIARLAVLL